MDNIGWATWGIWTAVTKYSLSPLLYQFGHQLKRYHNSEITLHVKIPIIFCETSMCVSEKLDKTAECLPQEVAQLSACLNWVISWESGLSGLRQMTSTCYMQWIRCYLVNCDGNRRMWSFCEDCEIFYWVMDAIIEYDDTYLTIRYTMICLWNHTNDRVLSYKQR